jgi:hypothetical protein
LLDILNSRKYDLALGLKIQLINLQSHIQNL